MGGIGITEKRGKKEKRALISAMGNGKDIPETRENYIANYQIILRIGEWIES